MTYTQAAAKSKSLRDQVRENDKELGDFSSSIGNYADAFTGLGNVFERATGIGLGFAAGGGNPLGELGAALEKMPGNVGKIGGLLKGVPPQAAIAVAAVAKIGAEVIEINNRYDQLRSKVQSVTGAIEDQLDSAVVGVATFSEVFEKDVDDSLAAANALVQNFGITFDEAFDLMKTASLAGADAQGDLLTKLKEYPTQFQNAGFSAEEMIKIMTQEVRGGIYDDKLTDGIKEADISLREFTKTQRDAIANTLGDGFADQIFDKINNQGASTKDIILDLAQAADENQLSQQEMAIITADIFKGAGEDAGGLENIISNITTAIGTDIEDLVDTQDEWINETNRLYESQERLNEQQNTLSQLLGNTNGGFKVLWNGIKTLGIETLNGLVSGFASLTSGVEALLTLDPSKFKTIGEVVQEAKKASDLQKKRDEDKKRRDELEVQREKEKAKQKKKDNQEAEQAARDREKAQKDKERLAKKAAKEEEKRIEKEQKDHEKLLEKKAKNEEDAASKISKLKAGLVEDEFDRAIALKELSKEDAVASLVGTPEQIEEQKRLLEDQLDNEIALIEEKRKEKEKKDQEGHKKKLEGDRVKSEEAKIAAVEAIRDLSASVAIATITDKEELDRQLKLIDLNSQLEANRIKLENTTLTLAQQQELLRNNAEIERNINQVKNEDINEQNEEAAERRAEIEEALNSAYAAGLEKLGEAFVGLFSGQEDAMKVFGKVILGILFDVLESAIRANAIAAFAVEVGTKGLFGLPSGFVAQAVVLGLLKGLRSVLAFEDGGAINQLLEDSGSYLGSYNGGGSLFPAKRGGLIKGPSHKNGGVKFKLKNRGKQFMGEARGGEVILNEGQVENIQSIGGSDIFKQAGVPGAGKNGFYEGGGFVPQVASLSPATSSQASTRLHQEDLDYMIMGIGMTNKALNDDTADVVSRNVGIAIRGEEKRREFEEEAIAASQL